MPRYIHPDEIGRIQRQRSPQNDPPSDFSASKNTRSYLDYVFGPLDYPEPKEVNLSATGDRDPSEVLAQERADYEAEQLREQKFREQMLAHGVGDVALTELVVTDPSINKPEADVIPMPGPAQDMSGTHSSHDVAV